jgi:hypothetical protein
MTSNELNTRTAKYEHVVYIKFSTVNSMQHNFI